MKSIIILVILLLSALQCNALYAEKCDYHTEKYVKRLNVTGICIPDKHIVHAIEEIDIDGDGIDEYMLYWRKKNVVEGDTTFISFYTQLNDTTVSLLKIIDNYYPLYIDYDAKYHSEKINSLIECYGYKNPQGYSSFDETGIYLNINVETGFKIRLEYKYDKNENDWYLWKKTECYTINEGLDEECHEIVLPNTREWFRNFSYQIFLGC